MRNRMKWAMLLVMVVISTNVWAAWDPDADSSLAFNMDFENNPTPTTTVDAVGSHVGTAYDYNTVSLDLWEESGKIDTSADFGAYNDESSGEANDCQILVPADPNFDWGFPEHKFTYTLWFNTDDLDSVTFIRRGPPGPEPEYEDWWWEIHIDEGKLHCFHKKMFLRMETVQTLSELGVTVDTWHSAAIVVDRTALENSKIYVDGLEAPVTYTAPYKGGDASVDSTYDICPLEIGGAGEFEFEGLLDEIRIYHKVLSPLEVSILHQSDGEVKPIALLPIPRSHNVSVDTDLSWEPAAGATAQEVFFGTDVNSLGSVASGDGGMSSVANSLLNSGSPLDLSTTYYWVVDSNIGGSILEGSVWSFTTETGKPFDPSPADGEEDVPLGTVNLQWTGSASATSFDVYFSDDKSLVEANNVSVRVANNITASNKSVSAPVKGETYYWRVMCNFGGASTTPGPVWSFRTIPKLIIVNTSDALADYNDVNYAPITFTDTETATVTDGNLGDDDVAIFKFAGDVNFSEHYDIVVIPLFDDVLEADMNALGHRQTSRPMAIHVTGNAYLNCKIDVSGLEAPDTETGPSSQARCGGHRGSYRGESAPPGSLPESYNIEIFGPGYGATGGEGTKWTGAGGGHGGTGGDAQRAGGGSGGDPYGYEQVPVPLGGSAGGWSARAAGGPGGGAVEIAATGNIAFGPEARLLVDGGDAPAADYGSGGGSGGSVRIIASGSVTNEGIISADGARGGDTTQLDEPKNPGGGGGGGRVSIFYGTTYTNNGQITVAGGQDGECPEGDIGLSQPGGDGTVFDSNANPAKPDFPFPPDGGEGVANDANQIELRWYPGFGATKNQVYLGTDPCNLVLVETIDAVAEHCGTLRAEQSALVDVNVGQTYYWYVKTTYGSTIDSKIWSFTPVEDFKIVFNTDNTYSVTYDGETIGPLECKVRDAGGWSVSPVATGSIASDGVAIFDFTGFNYNQNYNIIVLPEYGPERDANVTPTPLGINVTGDFYFDGDMDISGDNALTKEDEPKARSGGHRGPQNELMTAGGYYTALDDYPTGTRFGPYSSANKPCWIPTSPGYSLFGPGTPTVAPYKVGGGGGYGGIGGDSGRGYMSGVFSGGGDYGDKEVPVPFGGSGGGWGKDAPGGAGGGGVEIVATGNVTFGSNADIYAEGGSVLIASQYPSSGGSGGSVRVIAGGSFSNDGIISVCGGDGGDGNEKLNNTGGGGAGGRVAVFYGTTYTNTGQITANGGAKGLYAGESYGEDGQTGTIFASNGSPKKASAPTPRDGDEMLYVGGGSVVLKWYSGYDGSTDQVYFGTNPNPTTPLGSAVSATRGQHNSTVAAPISAGNTYYWKVVTDGAVSSDVWTFSVVDWQCPLANKPEWDAFYYYDCIVNLEDFAYFAQCWLEERDDMDWGATESGGITIFTSEWLDDSGRI